MLFEVWSREQYLFFYIYIFLSGFSLVQLSHSVAQSDALADFRTAPIEAVSSDLFIYLFFFFSPCIHRLSSFSSERFSFGH